MIFQREKQVTRKSVFLSSTALQFLRVERRHLTILSRYGIITAEKIMRSRIFDFLIASSSLRNGLDHSFDHLRLRTTWKQCLQEHPKASFLDSKAPKSLVNQGKNRLRFLWDQDVAGSYFPKHSRNARKSQIGFISSCFGYALAKNSH